MIQEIIVYAIGVALFCYLMFKLVKGIFGKQTNGSRGCSNCGCSKSYIRYKRVTGSDNS